MVPGVVAMRRRGLFGYLVLVAGIAAALYFTDSSRRALCAQRADIDHRIASQKQRLARTEKTLKDNPGPLVFGIPRKLIIEGLKQDREDLRNSEQTRKNLSFVRC